MKPTPLLSHLACVTIGLAIGHSMLVSQAVDSSANNTPTVPPSVTRSNREPRTDAARLRVSAAKQLLRSIPPDSSYSARAKWLADLAAVDLPRLIESLCLEIGPGGLDYHDKSLMDGAFKRWWDEDRDGVIGWVEQLPAGATKRYFIKQLMAHMIESAPDQALAISENYQAVDPKWDHMKAVDRYTEMKIGKAWKKPDVTAEEMLGMYAELQRGDGTSGISMGSYPPDFDFVEFLDGIAAWNGKDRKQPGTMPSDVLEVWARRDPQAAAEWFLKTTEAGTSVPFQDWKDIAKGVSEMNGVASYHTWAGELLPQVSDQQLSRIAQDIEARDAMGIAGTIADPRARDRVLATMARHLELEGAASMLGALSSPEAKMKAIEDRPYTFRKWIDEGKLTQQTLQQLGLSEAQVRAAIGDE